MAEFCGKLPSSSEVDSLMIAWLVLKTGLSPRLVKAGLVLFAIALALLSWKLWLSNHDAAVVDRHETKITAKVEKQARVADQKLEERKDAAEVIQAEERKEFDHATVHLPKSGLTDRQRVDACAQLRRQGQEPEICRRLP